MHSIFSTILYKEDNVCEFLLNLPTHLTPSEQWSALKEFVSAKVDKFNDFLFVLPAH